MIELISLHLLTHEVPLAILTVLGYFFGRKAVFSYVRKHDPIVQELLAAAESIVPDERTHITTRERLLRLRQAVAACEKDKCVQAKIKERTQEIESVNLGGKTVEERNEYIHAWNPREY